MWAGSFDELLLDAPRTDTPEHLPDAPAPAKPWGPIPNGTDPPKPTPPQPQRQQHPHHDANDSTPWRVDGAGGSAPLPLPQHCSHATGSCLGPGTSTQKQRNAAAVLADLLPDAAAAGAAGGGGADVARMSVAEADAWLRDMWGRWMATDDGFEKMW